MPTRALRNRLSQSDTWLLELFLGLYTLAWGLGFANPLTTVFSTNAASYRILGQFPGGETAFGIFVAALGMLALTATLRLRRATRTFSAAVNGIWWLFVTVSIGVPTTWAAGGIPHFALVALAHWFCWSRLRYSGER
jgi:hypothetical protein